MTTARELIEKGRIEGKAEGRAEGRRATLQRQLRLEFRALATDEVLARVAAADDDTVARLEERILVATTIDALFVVTAVP